MPRHGLTYEEAVALGLGDEHPDSPRQRQAAPATRPKYGAQPTVYRGIRFDSKAEANHAERLDHDATVLWVLRQVPVMLGVPEFVTRVDFVVGYRTPAGLDVVAEEVKGRETRDWPKIVRMWRGHGPFVLRVIRNGKVAEVIEPRRDNTPRA